MCPVPTKRLVLLAASALLLSTLIVTLRGISYTPADQRSTDDPLSLVDPMQVAGSKEIVSLRVVVSLPDEAYRVLQALNRNFLRENTDMTVRLSNLDPSSFDEYLTRAFRLGEASDIILLDNVHIKHHAGHARLQPTDDYFTRVTETEYLPIITEPLKWNGYLWGIPFQIEPYILAYNEAVWIELTGERMPNDAEWLWTVYQHNGLYIDEQDPMAYAALAYMLDRDWQFPKLVDPTDQAEPSAEDSEAASDPEAAEETEGEPVPQANVSTDDHEDDRSNGQMTSPMDVSLQQSTFAAGIRISDVSSADDENRHDGQGDGPEMGMTKTDGEEQREIADPSLDLFGRFSSDSANDPWERLRSGELAAIIAPLHEYESRRSYAISAILLPSVDGNNGALLTGKSFVLSADSTAQEEAFRWIRAILNSYHDEVSAIVSGGYPADADIYRLFVNNPTYGLLRSAVEKGHTLLPDPYLEQKLSLIRDQLPQLVQEHVTPQEAMHYIYGMFEEAGWLS